MARRKQVAEQAAQIVTVTVYRKQLSKLEGRTVASVAPREDGRGIVVLQKRERGGKCDKHLFDWPNVVAYAEGEGGRVAGRAATAYALVNHSVKLLQVTGEVAYNDEGEMLVTDGDGTVHVITTTAGNEINVSIIEQTGERISRGVVDDSDDVDVDDDGSEESDADADDDTGEDGSEEDEDDAGSDDGEDDGVDDDNVFSPNPPRGRRAKPAAKPAPVRGRAAAPAKAAPAGRKSRAIDEW